MALFLDHIHPFDPGLIAAKGGLTSRQALLGAGHKLILPSVGLIPADAVLAAGLSTNRFLDALRNSQSVDKMHSLMVPATRHLGAQPCPRFHEEPSRAADPIAPIAL